MKLYAIIDGDLNIIRGGSKNRLAIFKEMEMLKQNAWRYTRSNIKYKILEFENTEVYDFEEED